jgi:deoxycytidine triphosphate deaminase
MQVRRYMLSGEEILERLRCGDIFQDSTWKEDNVGLASYDLRVASDFLILPKGKRINVGKEVKEVHLYPGDVALVSTMERFCLSWELVGNMSPRFSQAKGGVLVPTEVLSHSRSIPTANAH